MKPYDRFVFDSYSFDPKRRRIELRYSLETSAGSPTNNAIHFTETITFPQDSRFEVHDAAALDRALFALHLIGGVSYFKTCCPKTIEVQSGELSESQAEFWSQVYEKGLGEFFYRNREKIAYVPGMIHFPSTPNVEAPVLEKRALPPRTLITVGGGKDSIVTIEHTPGDTTLLRIGGNPIIDQIASIAGKPLITIERTLSPTLFKLNETGALNGHVPITAYVSALSVVAALLYGFTRVLMSNEKSADEGNLRLDALEVNHQWSKSREFEEAFSNYLATWVTKDVTYESALRDLSELEVVGAFSVYPQYFHAFTSCNKNWKITAAPRGRDSGFTWCCRCPKCAFVFLLLAAHLPRKTVISIFGHDLFEDESLWPLYEELLALRGHKPFECVGTPEETRQAFAMAIERDAGWKDTPILQHMLAAHAHL